MEFAARLADSAYQDGYVRGFERSERLGPDWHDPDATAAILEHQAEVALGNVEGFDPAMVVPVNEDVPQETAGRAALAMNEAWRARQGSRRGPRRTF